MQGKIERKIQDRGFGFINVEGKEDSIFFHRSQVQGNLGFDELLEGQEVEFEVEQTPKGLQAVNVTKVE